MNPYEPPQVECRDASLPLASEVDSERLSRNEPDFSRRNKLLFRSNCLFPWLVASGEILFAKPKTGFITFDFLPGIVWIALNLIWWGCFLGLSWTNPRQFLRGLGSLCLVFLHFVAAIYLRESFLPASPSVDLQTIFIGLFRVATKLGLIALIFVSSSAGLVLLLRFRSHIIDANQMLRFGRTSQSWQWSLWSMVYCTLLIAAAISGVRAGLDIWVCLYLLYILLLWHTLLQIRVSDLRLGIVLAFGIGMQILHFKLGPFRSSQLRDTLELWVTGNILVLAMGITARWAGWRIVRRPPLDFSLKKSLAGLGSRIESLLEL